MSGKKETMNSRILNGPGDGETNLPTPGVNCCFPDIYYRYSKPLLCGPIRDPYCPSQMGVVGGQDDFGFNTCCCPRSGACYTSRILPLGDPPQAVVTWPMGPFVYARK